MSRSDYSDDCDGWDLIRWRGAVESAIRGRRGQAFLREMRDALDAMPEKRLIAHELVTSAGECCGMGAVCLARGQDVTDVDPLEPDDVAEAMGIAGALAKEIAYENDECGRYDETPEERWRRVRRWVDKQIPQDDPTGATA